MNSENTLDGCASITITCRAGAMRRRGPLLQSVGIDLIEQTSGIGPQRDRNVLKTAERGDGPIVLDVCEV